MSIDTIAERRARVLSIGTPGTPWGEAEYKEWTAYQESRPNVRSYADTVMAPLQALAKTNPSIKVEQYGELSHDPARYPLYSVKVGDWRDDKDIVVVTGGVHGYEESGVFGAMRFIQENARDYTDKFNVLVVPCVNPSGWETDNRRNHHGVDPNRSFNPSYTPSDPEYTEEGAFLMAHVSELQESLGRNVVVHVDLHETTDTDNSIFRPERDAMEGKPIPDSYSEIPPGYYLVGTEGHENRGFEAAAIKAIGEVTPIAPPDENGNIIGEPVDLEHPGVVYYGFVGLCGQFTPAAKQGYAFTTETYPDGIGKDGKPMTQEECIKAQVVSVTASLDYYIEHNNI